jgi:hypothetical protein
MTPMAKLAAGLRALDARRHRLHASPTGFAGFEAPGPNPVAKPTD